MSRKEYFAKNGDSEDQVVVGRSAVEFALVLMAIKRLVHSVISEGLSSTAAPWRAESEQKMVVECAICQGTAHEDTSRTRGEQPSWRMQGSAATIANKAAHGCL